MIISGSGRADLGLPVLASSQVPALIVTTTAGENRLRREKAPESVEIRAARSSASTIRATSILEQVDRRPQMSAGKLILVEGGPQLLGAFYREHTRDERFLTLAPQIAGRDVGDQRLSLVMRWDVRAPASSLGNLDQPAARQQAPVSALHLPHAISKEAHDDRC